MRPLPKSAVTERKISVRKKSIKKVLLALVKKSLFKKKMLTEIDFEINGIFILKTARSQKKN